MGEQKPTVGRIVHYCPPQDCKGATTLDHYGAMITQVNADGSVELVTFGPNSVYFQHSVRASTGYAAGCWSWPPKV